MSDPMQERAALVQKLMEQKYGEDSSRAGIEAMTSQGVDPRKLAEAVAQPDAVDRIHMMGRDALISCADHDNAAAMRLAEIRDAERVTHRKLRRR